MRTAATGALRGTHRQKHIFVGQTRIASKLHYTDQTPSTRALYMQQNTFYYHPDHLGSTNWVTDHQGEGYEHFTYTPYGEAWVEEHLSSKIHRMSHRFTGQELDPETGLYAFPARNYDPKTGLWLSGDPAGPTLMVPGREAFSIIESTNWYSYVSNNPLRYIDPTGLGQTEVDMRALSMHVRDGGAPPDGYEIVDPSDLGLDIELNNADTGLQSQLYRNKESGEYVYAFAGLDPRSGPDRRNGRQQWFGGSSRQYVNAIDNTLDIRDAVGADNLRTTGSSLGGGLAAAAATVAGVRGTTFNAQGVHPNTLAEFDRTAADAVGLVDAFSLQGDALTRIQNRTGRPDALGTQHVLSVPGRSVGQGINRHFIDHPAWGKALAAW